MYKIKEIEKAAQVIDKTIIQTPLVYSPTISRIYGIDVWLKLENLQKTGSFKIRGAAYKILSCLKKIGDKGVVAASAGNHAQGVALAAYNAAIPSYIVMPEWASISKQEATRGYGGKVILHGQSVGDSLKKAKQIALEGKTFIHPFDDYDIITGQGTIGLEILKDLKNVDMIIVPVGGGGLISGISLAAKSINPKIKIIGVQAAFCPSTFESRVKGKITQVNSKFSIADGISVKQPGNITFEIMQKYVDDVILVEEEQIAASILMLLERKKILAEGAGAVPLAALMSGYVKIPKSGKVVLVISGGNVDSPLLGRIIQKGLLKNGRIMRIKLHLSDIPGSLSRVLALIAGLKANVLHIYHDRDVKNMPINMTYVELELETRSFNHINEIKQKLHNAGYNVLC